MQYSNKHFKEKEKEREKEKDKEREIKKKFPFSVSTYDLSLTVIYHLQKIFEIHGGKLFSPSTLFQLRDSPAVTLTADVTATRALVSMIPDGSEFSTTHNSSSSSGVRKKDGGNVRDRCLSELWARSAGK